LALVSDRDYRFLFASFNFAIVFSSYTVFPFPLKTAKLIDGFLNSGRAREPIQNQFAQMGKAQRKERKIREI
jgi:hypothetical protein